MATKPWTMKVATLSRLWTRSPRLDRSNTVVHRINSARSFSSEPVHPSSPPLPPLPPRDDAVTTAPRTSGTQRRRYRFGDSVEEVPSFRDFQQRTQIWSLYRQFTRLVYQSTTSADASNSNSSSNSNTVQAQRSEMQGKIRHEFILPQSDNWHIQRALSEGSRRYKELSAMLGNSVKRKVTVSHDSSNVSHTIQEEPNNAPAVAKPAWPWNRSTSGTTGTGKRPPVFPRKSNG